MNNYLTLILIGLAAFSTVSQSFAAEDPFNIDLTPSGAPLESAGRPEPRPAPLTPSPVSTVVQNLNPDLSFIGDFVAGNTAALTQRGDPQQRTVRIREVEVDGAGYISPYAKGFVVVSFSPDGPPDIEEAYTTLFELPYGFGARLGKFLLDTDTLNPNHLHAYPFVDRPLAWHHLLDGDGLKSVGANLSWLVPNPWDHYLLISFSAGMNQEDQNQYSLFYGGNLKTPLFTVRGSTSVDFTDLLYATFNFSYLASPLPDQSVTSVYMADVLARFVPNPFSNSVTFLNGVLWGRGNPNGTGSFYTTGFYNYLGWQFSPRWKIGARYDYVNDSTFGGVERQVAGILSFYPTETNYFRLQYGAHRMAAADTDPDVWENRVWFQLDFSMGPHQAHAAL